MPEGNQSGLQRAIFGKIQAAGKDVPHRVELDYGHGRIIRRFLWPPMPVTWTSRTHPGSRGSAATATTSPAPDQQGDRPRRHQPRRGTGRPADLAAVARGQWGIESVHWLRSPGLPGLLHDVARCR
jgi:hypothetical protein